MSPCHSSRVIRPRRSLCSTGWSHLRRWRWPGRASSASSSAAHFQSRWRRTGAPPITVITGEEAHPTLLKSLGMLGLGRGRIVRVPADGQGRMRAGALPPITGPSIVCLQAGNVNTGAFDPFEPLIESAHAAGAWVHVDGAFGLWAKAAPTLRQLARGVEHADSWATDAH